VVVQRKRPVPDLKRGKGKRDGVHHRLGWEKKEKVDTHQGKIFKRGAHRERKESQAKGGGAWTGGLDKKGKF